jgi:hypothetical protein
MNRDLTRKTFLKIVMCALAAAAAALSTPATASAQIDQLRPFTYDFGAMGVPRGQVARLNVFYHDQFPPGPCAPGESCLPPGPCAEGSVCTPASYRMSLNFTDEVGNVVATRAMTLTPDKGAALVYAPSSFRADGRATVRANIVVEPEAGYVPLLVPTVEVIDPTSGQTSIINPGTRAGFNPQPEPPGDSHFGLFNVVKGQTARVHVSNVGAPGGLPPGPCRADVTFYDGEGRVVGSETLWLAPGQTLASDFSTAGMPAGWRGRIRAGVHAELLYDRGGAATVASSLEVFASDTGRGMLFYPGALIGLL